jgi:response regulator RpfG family c-di-GMP phosphodiesterase
MSQEKTGTILVVDDEEIIREMMVNELESGYTVYSAENGTEAFKILQKTPIDLVISDINMPDMSGFDLIGKVKGLFPKTKTALITAYDINDFVRMAKEHDVSNIISKSIPFNFDEFNSIIKNLITEHIFGLENYMLSDYEVHGEFTITDSQQIVLVEEQILELISKFNKPEPFVNMLLEELITNAIYHAPVDEYGHEKYVKHSNVILAESETVKVIVGRDSEKYGVSVMDTSGKLTKDMVLYKIDRHLHGEGLLDENGRGLHMSRLYSDRLILNIKKNHATEALFINFITQKYKGYKPLFINEI